jgi:hypothetical protein
LKTAAGKAVAAAKGGKVDDAGRGSVVCNGERAARGSACGRDLICAKVPGYSADVRLCQPGSMSIHEERSPAPLMGVFNLVVFDQHVAQKSLASIVPDR